MRFFALPSAPLRRGAAILVLAILAGCASQPNAHPRDPLEPLNREVYRFNDAVDGAVFKPLAQGYQQVVPALVRTGVDNFFGNLGDAWSFVNNVLQLKAQPALESVVRFSVNTVLGVGGLLDIADEMGIERHRQDFGQTLAHYGVPTGPYVVLPLLGPSTLRDALVLPIDTRADVVRQLDHIPTRNELYALRLVDRRSQLLRVSDVLQEAALDPYSFTRDAWLQIRDNQAPYRGKGSGSSDGAIENPDEPQ
ncbi:MAG: VacJ family lipoprotein [Burkholderiaceae bacterium]|nr:VacJ family lipoprotein [Burkholderiaceae bacterium]